MTAVGRAAVATKQPLPGTEQDAPNAEQPPADAKQATPSPYGDDVEEAAALLVDRARRDVANLDLVDRYDSIVWWRLAHLRAAELLHDVVRGEPLVELAEKHTYRQIEKLLAADGTTVSDSTISKLIGAWKRWTAGASSR